MGLDGGTYITRSDVLRGQSWELATADNSRSTRGGNASTSAAKSRNVIDARTAKCVYGRFKPLAVHLLLRFCLSQCRLTVLNACEQEHSLVYMLFVQPATLCSNSCRLSGQPVQQVILQPDASEPLTVTVSHGKCWHCREAVLEFLLSRGGAFIDDSAQVA